MALLFAVCIADTILLMYYSDSMIMNTCKIWQGHMWTRGQQVWHQRGW